MIRGLIAVTLALVVLLVVTVTHPAPTGTAPARFDDAAQITHDTWTVVDPADCWEEPEHAFGRTATRAVVRELGGTTVEVWPADEAWDHAAAGHVWVLAWCEGETR